MAAATSVFLSHAGEQKTDGVGDLHQRMLREWPELGVTVFLDQLSIQGGTPGWPVIEAALKKASIGGWGAHLCLCLQFVWQVDVGRRDVQACLA
jgi:hypothetical protein